MKKAALILLLTVYGLASFGVGLKQFYCCGNLASTQIGFTHHQKTEKGCCQTVYQFFKVSDRHGAAADIISPEKDTILLDLTPVYKGITIASYQTAPVANGSNAPPLHCGVPIFIFNCIYRL